MIHNHRVTQVYLFNNGVLNTFNKRLFNNLSYFLDNFLNKWDFDNFLNLDRDFPYDFNKFFYNNFNWLDDFLFDEFLSDHFDFSDFYLFNNHLHDLFNNLRHFNDSLNCPDDRNNFFHNTINWFVNRLNMIVHL